MMFGNVLKTDIKCLQMFINVYKRLLLQGIQNIQHPNVYIT